MNRTTIYALVAFVVLLGVVLAVRTLPGGPEEHQLEIAGWKKAEPAAAPAAAAPDAGAATPAPAPAAPVPDEQKAPEPPKEELSPIDRVEITRDGATIVLEQQGEDRKKWRITKPIEAQADWFRLRPILDAFKEPLESSLSKTVKPDDLRLFKLDEAHRIRVKLVDGGQVFADLVVGGTEKADEAGAEQVGATDRGDTWVMKPGEEGRAYRLPGVDLRTPLDYTLSDLRSKKVFDREKASVNRIVIENPDDANYPRIVLVREDAAAGGAEGAAKAEGQPEGAWRFETPKGFRPGSIDGFLGQVLGLYATEFLAADDAEGKAALADKPARVTLETADGSIALQVSQPGESFAYVRVEGSSEIIKVSQYTAKNLRKTLSDLRDKKVFAVDAEVLAAIRLTTPKGEVSLRRQGTVWTAEAPAGLELSQKAAQTLARDVAGFTVTEWVGSAPPETTGLDAPTRRLTVETGAGETGGGVRTLLLGKEEDAKVWGTLEGSPEVFRVSNFVAQKLDKSPEDLTDRSVFGLERDALTRIELREPGATAATVLERAPAAAAEPAPGAPPPAPASGWKVIEGELTADANRMAAAALVSTLANLEAKDVVAAPPADAGLDDAAAFQVTVATGDGARRTLWLGREESGAVFAKTDAPRWAGKVFTIAPAQASALRKPPAELKSAPAAPGAGLLE